MTTVSLSSIPGELSWKNDPEDWEVGPENSLTITAGPKTDWFVEPSGSDWVASSAPAALFSPPDRNFLLSAKVTVDFGETFDAGVLMIYERDDLWAKLCFEYSPQNQPMIVTVVTRGMSDDCNSVAIDGNTVYLRVARIGTAFAFHYSLDGKVWTFVRYFTLGPFENLQVGFLTQSPTGQGCKARFSEIAYRPGMLKELRNGE